MTDIFSVSDRIAVVTGGLGLLGRTFTAALAGRGTRVAILDVEPDCAAALRRFDVSLADRIRYLIADVGDRPSLEAALAEIEATWGPPDVLVNNAALDSPPDASAEENGPFETYPGQSWDRVLEVNLKGVFQCCQVFGGRMARVGRGTVINVSSIYGLVSPDQRIYDYRRAGGEPYYKPVAYSASKSGLLNLTRYLATYWADRGVRVNTVTFAGVSNQQDPAFLQRYESHVPLGRMARAEEYVGPLIFLASDASSYMTGANLVVDGGWTAW